MLAAAVCVAGLQIALAILYVGLRFNVTVTDERKSEFAQVQQADAITLIADILDRETDIGYRYPLKEKQRNPRQ